MESREKCEHIIQIFNKKVLRGAKEALLVKFADSGNKKRNQYKSKDQNNWERPEVSVAGFHLRLRYINMIIPINSLVWFHFLTDRT